MYTDKSSAIEPSNDTDLARRVKTFLATQFVGSSPHIDVTAVADSVILSGRVRNFHERQLAIACCKRVAGVREIYDRLQVPIPKRPA